MMRRRARLNRAPVSSTLLPLLHPPGWPNEGATQAAIPFAQSSAAADDEDKDKDRRIHHHSPSLTSHRPREESRSGSRAQSSSPLW